MQTSSLGGALFKKKTLKVLGTLSILAVLSLGAATYQFLYPSLPTSASSYSSSVQVGAKIKEYIMMALDTNLLALKDSAGNTVISPAPSGTEITGNVNVAVTTNTAQGYALNVYSQDNTKAMVHQDPNVPSTIAPIDTVSGYDASTGISTLSANTWGFRRNTGTISSPIYSNWYAIGANESTGTVIVNTNTGTGEYCKTLSYPLNDSGCDANTYETHIINFGANITPDLASGTYTNNVVFSAVAKSEGEKYTLRFYPNGGTNTMGPRTIINGSTVTMPSTGYQNGDYVIKGWALTQADAELKTANPNATTTYDTFNAGIAIPVSTLIESAIAAGQATADDSTINVYAIWGEPPIYMQNWTGCSSLSTNATIQMTDSRDGNKYWVKKLADGNCWMVENLRLIDKSITSSDSNVSSNFTVPTSTDPTRTSWCNTSSAGSACYDQPLAYYDSSTRSSYGALYNWYTATAGTGTYSTSSGTATSSICPKGWRLPTGGSGGEFEALDIAWGGTGSDRSDANTYSTFTGSFAEGSNGGFDLPGYAYRSSLGYVGLIGIWWSATASSSDHVYLLFLYPVDTSVNFYADYKFYGLPVRCIASV